MRIIIESAAIILPIIHIIPDETRPCLDGDGITDLAAGATGDDDGGPGTGALWIVFLDGAPICAADIDGDRVIGVLDLLLMLAAWLTDPCGPPDLDGNGEVGVTDLLLLLGTWGMCR